MIVGVVLAHYTRVLPKATSGDLFSQIKFARDFFFLFVKNLDRTVGGSNLPIDKNDSLILYEPVACFFCKKYSCFRLNVLFDVHNSVCVVSS